jgi:DNA-binding transcriptional MocR family regulator
VREALILLAHEGLVRIYPQVGTFVTRIDPQAVADAAYERGVLVDPGAWHWARREQAPPSLLLGYGAASAPAIRRGIAILRAALLETSTGTIP